MADKIKCETPLKHKDHMCKLKKDGRTEELEKFQENPIVFCNKCKMQANDPCRLCNPRAIKGARG